MAVRQAFTIGLLFMLITSIGCALLLYKNSQQQLTLEGNRLYSTHSINTVANLNEVAAQWSATSDNFVAYKTLDASSGIRGVYSPDFSEVSYPVHEGRSFARNDTMTALVGSKVELTSRNNKMYYDFRGTEYEVVGYLGRDESSLVENEVLLAHEALFSAHENEPIVLDGPNVSERYYEFFGDRNYESVNQSTNRRTNVDFISPLLLALGTGMMFLGAVYTGLLAASHVHHENYVKVLIGRTRRYTICLSMIRFGCLAFCATLLLALIWNIVVTLTPGLSTAWPFWPIPISMLAMATAMTSKSKVA